MTYIGEAKNRIIDLVEKVKDKALRGEKDESDVSSDPHVASSRAANDGDDGTYVGRTGPDVALDVEQSGAEARSEQNRDWL
ncbi:hypothetical protein [Mycobacterium sp.]|uniref:hypothetical protein n=1 Tax=Mycobacterium sp. TaxID=1785 RepID=UPI003C7877DF